MGFLPSRWDGEAARSTHGCVGVCYSQKHRGVTALPAQVVGKRNQEATEGWKQRRDVLCAPWFLWKTSDNQVTSQWGAPWRGTEVNFTFYTTLTGMCLQGPARRMWWPVITHANRQSSTWWSHRNRAYHTWALILMGDGVQVGEFQTNWTNLWECNYSTFSEDIFP